LKDRIWKSGIVVAVLGTGALLSRESVGLVPRALQALEGSRGSGAAVAFIALYVAATVAWMPASILTLAAGALFGPVRGFAFALTGATMGAALAFLIARHVARAAVERRLGTDPRLTAIDQAIGRDASRLVLLLRLSPVFPFSAMNYALGLTQARFRDYFPATVAGMAPGSMLYVYAGFIATQIPTQGLASTPGGAWRTALLAAGLLATLSVAILLGRAAKQALRGSAGLAATTASRRDPW
jgi:uncharacterized membrane protein YdjX (TVP38/TMEM64 family)